MILQTLLLIAINILGIFLGIIVLRDDHKDKVNICFGLLTLAALFWVNSAYLGFLVDNVFLAEFYFKINYGAVIITLVLFYMFFVFYLRRKQTLLNTAVITISSILFTITMITDSVISGVIGSNGYDKLIQYSSLADVFNIYTVLIVGLILYMMLAKRAKSSKKAKKRLNYFFIGILIYMIMNIIFNVIYPTLFNTFKYSWLADYSLIIFLALSAYAIIYKGLFDVKTAVVRSVTYSLVVASLALLYLAISYVLSTFLLRTSIGSTSQVIVGVVTSLILVLVFQPIKRFFDRISNKLFYRNSYHVSQFVSDINQSLTSTTDLRELLKRISEVISRDLQSSQTFFFIYTSEDRFISDGTDRHRRLPKYDANQIILRNGKKTDLIICDSLEHSDPIRKSLISHKINTILPLIHGNQTLGLLCLGDNLTSNYSSRDYRVLKAVSNSLVVAIQNALVIHEMKELNATLKQRIGNATKELRKNNRELLELDQVKDDFINMASHQLRTPLTSIKGYLSMIIEGDLGKVSRKQKEILLQAFNSSERMVRLINDFLNVSRLQSGKFTVEAREVDLIKLIEQEIDTLEPVAFSHNLKLVFKKPRQAVKISIDEEKIRQVVMNFMDNAIYYSPGKSKIIIKLEKKSGEVIFTVKDNGIGVPESEKDKLFTKFFRATNARNQRPDGTGVGLYLANKIIESHKGQIVFESKQGKGSTFGFKLRVK